MSSAYGVAFALLLSLALGGCSQHVEGIRMPSRDDALAEMSTVVHRLTSELHAEWTQRVAPSTGPCSEGGIRHGLEWADHWDGIGTQDRSAVVAKGESIMKAAGFRTERQPAPYGERVHAISADGGTILLDVANSGDATIIARSACFPESPAAS